MEDTRFSNHAGVQRWVKRKNGRTFSTEAHANGRTVIDSPNGHTESTEGKNINHTHGDNFITASKTLELCGNEVSIRAFGGFNVVTGTPAQMHNNLGEQIAANKERQEYIAARSGFNDNRDSALPSVSEFIPTPPSITDLANAGADTTIPFPAATGMILVDIASLGAYYADYVSSYSLERVKETALLSIKHEVEVKAKRLAELKKQMTQKPTLNERFVERLLQNPLAALLGFSSDKLELEDTHDVVTLQEKAIKASEATLDVQSQL